MKVFRRILIKLILLILVIVLFGGAAYVVHYYPYSVPASALEEYLTLLVENNTEKAYELLDQSEYAQLTLEVYESAIKEGKYALYDSWQVEEVSERQGTNGESYVDYHVEFLDSSENVQLEGDFTVKRQSEAILGVMDQWKVLADHCLVLDLHVTVPDGSTVYLDAEEADSSWLVTDDVAASMDCYEIPSLLPESVDVVIRHPILESLEITLDPLDGDVDYCEEMTLKESAKAECEELAVAALKQLYVSSVTGETDDLEDVFGECLEDAVAVAESQTEEFYREDTVTYPEFESVGIYGYDAEFGDPVFTEDANGAITTSLTFTYHYVVRNTERVETGEIWADGENAWEWQTVPYSGKAVAEFTMSYYEDEWHITEVTLPVIPESD